MKLFGTILVSAIAISATPVAAFAQEKAPPADKSQREEAKKPADPMSQATFSGLGLRSIGPALTSGRVAAFAVDPSDRRRYFVAAASGGVWKTMNAGTTWTPVFDNEGSYSIGAVALDPKNPAVVWVGTGENNSQRSVGYGDGIYRSEDGGKSWKNIGLKSSEHIGRILIDPRNRDTVYVASQGPLWGPGGDRGLFKTVDGGKTWKNVLSISPHTGVTDLVMDPENPDTLYAAAYQRRRHVWTLIDGGPESALYKSTDAGTNWTKLKSGLPTVDLGRLGLAISPADPRVIYATVEAADHQGGIFRSTDRGATWEKRNDFDSGAMYYGTVFADPKNVDRIYVMNVMIQVSDDGGKTLYPMNSRSRHVDNHALWIDPKDTDYYLLGCDGGVYESFDRGANWSFKANLPVTQFYDVAVDNSAPFYYVYGGAQDNFSLGGPSRTRSASGIINTDWFVTMGGDGFRTQIDPQEPNTIYAELQNGVLARFDKRTGQRMGIMPSEGKGDAPLRWNWDSPLIISPHSHTRLYFAANLLFRSDDRGDSWRTISGELSRGIDRNKLPVMGRIWGPDAVAKSASTSFYGNATALTESQNKEGLLYVGTDDGLIQVTEDGGQTWRKDEKFPGVPEMTYVSRLLASRRDVNAVYAAFDNHKNADFAPYLLKSTDRGRSWISIKGDLPGNGPVLAIAEDHANPNLLFVGTEFGLYFTLNGGQKWIRLKGGFPTISVRDLAIQQRESDLAVATFGRGFYILDDYTPLRVVTTEMLAQPSALFPVKNALLYIEATPLGGRGQGWQGASFFVASNPPFGATFTYYLKDPLRTKKQQRQEAEKEAEKKGSTLPYPSAQELREEAEEQASTIALMVRDADGNVVRRIEGPISAGIHRVSWDLRYPAPYLPPPRQREDGDEELSRPASGPLVMPGPYQVSLVKRVNGVWTDLAGPQPFSVVAEGTEQMAAPDRAALVEFQRKVARLQGAVIGALEAANSLKTRLGLIDRALEATPAAGSKLRDDAFALRRRTDEILLALRGDEALRARNENTKPSIEHRVNKIVGEERMSTARPTETQQRDYTIAGEEFAPVLAKLRELIEVDLAKLEKAMEAAGAPHTPGRIPDWKKD